MFKPVELLVAFGYFFFIVTETSPALQVGQIPPNIIPSVVGHSQTMSCPSTVPRSI